MINDYIKKYGLTKYLVENGANIYTFGIEDKLLAGKSILQFNPGIATIGDDIIASIRSVDYSIWMSYDKDISLFGNDFQYNSDGEIHSYLYIGKANKNEISFNEFQEVQIERPNNHTMYKGIEDCRLVVWDGELYASGTSREGNDDWSTRIHLCHLNVGNDGKFYESSYDVVPADETDSPSCEKNWMPVNDKPFTWIKWANPTVVVRYDPNTKNTTTYKHCKNDSFPTDLRGSSNVIKVGKCYYCIVHHVEIESDKSKYYKKYLSNILEFDDSLNLIRCSESFSFDTSFPIQFVCGMAYDGKHLYISYSTDDSSSYILEVESEKIVSLI